MDFVKDKFLEYKMFVNNYNINDVKKYISKMKPRYKKLYIETLIKNKEYVGSDTLYYIEKISIDQLDSVIKNGIPYLLTKFNYSIMTNRQFKNHRKLLSELFDIIDYYEKQDLVYYVLLKRKRKTNKFNFPLYFDQDRDYIMLHNYMKDLEDMPIHDEIDIKFGVDDISKNADTEIKTQIFHNGDFYEHYRKINSIYLEKVKQNNLFIINNNSYSEHCQFLDEKVKGQLMVEPNNNQNVYPIFINLPYRYYKIFAKYMDNMLDYFFREYEVDKLTEQELTLIQKKFPINYCDRGKVLKLILGNDVEKMIQYVGKKK